MLLEASQVDPVSHQECHQVEHLRLGQRTGDIVLPSRAGPGDRCSFIRGIDRFPAMLSRCRDRLLQAGIPSDRAAVSQGDITDFDLDRRFDLVIAPFRVLQNLETDAEVNGLLDGIRRHLALGGKVVLNAFRPNMEPDQLRSHWVKPGEQLAWTVPVEGGRVECWLSFMMHGSAAEAAKFAAATMSVMAATPANMESILLPHGLLHGDGSAPT